MKRTVKKQFWLSRDEAQELQKKAKRYQELYDRADLSDEERAERADLKRELKNAESVLAKIEEKKVS